MKRMFYAARTPSFLSLPLSVSSVSLLPTLCLRLSLSRSPACSSSRSSSVSGPLGHLVGRSLSLFLFPSFSPSPPFLVLPSPPLSLSLLRIGLQNTYHTYRLLPAAFPVILSGHRRPGRELLLTCMHVVSHLYTLHLLSSPRRRARQPVATLVRIFIHYIETSRGAALCKSGELTQSWMMVVLLLKKLHYTLSR